MAHRHPLALLLAASLLAACQALPPGVTRPFTPSFRLPAPGTAADHAGQVTVRVDHPRARRARALLATAADVDRLTIRLDGDGVGHVEPITRAMLLAGRTSVTFAGLPAGELAVTVTAFDAAGDVIGRDVKAAAITAGQTTTVDATVQLTPAVPSPRVLEPGGAGAGGTGPGHPDLVDGVPVYAPAVRGTYAPEAEDWPRYDQVVLDAQGHAWFTGVHSFDDPSHPAHVGRVSPADVLTLFPVPATTAMGLATNAAGDRIYVSEDSTQGGNGATSALTTAGAVVGSAPPGFAGEALAIAPDGTAYAVDGLADPPRIVAAAPGGTSVDVFQADPYGGPPGATYATSFPMAVACDATGHVVSLWHAEPADPGADAPALFVRRQAPDGTLVFEKAYPAGGNPSWNAIALDAQGQVWVPVAATRAVEKLSPAGAVLGAYPVGLAADAVHVDPAGRVWAYAVGRRGTEDYIARLAPTGELRAYYFVEADLFKGDLAVSADDHMWLVAIEQGLIHLKLDPLP